MKKSSSTSVFNDRGFTLLEILIAITLLAFITIGVVSVTENSIMSMERTTEQNKNNLQVETALSRFEWDFSQIYSPLYFSTVMNVNKKAIPDGGANGAVEGGDAGGDTGQMSPEVQNYYEQLNQRLMRNEHFASVSKEGLPIPRFYAPEKNVFEFFTSSNRRKVENTKQSHFAWVRYSLADAAPDKEEIPNVPKSLKNLVRYFTADDPYNELRINIDDAKAAVLLENVESLEFQYWDYARRRWETSLKSVAGGENLLRGVKILVTWYDGSGNKRTVERIFRTNWPMVAPQDPVTNGNTTGATTGATTGGIDGSTDDGTTTTAGATGGVVDDEDSDT